jgi:RES domain
MFWRLRYRMHMLRDWWTRYRAPSVLCSECFEDDGLRYEARSFRRKTNDICQHCGARNGPKLTKFDAEDLARKFFSHATAPHTFQGFVPILKYGVSKEYNIDRMLEPTRKDLSLLTEVTGFGVFYNAPRLFYLGVTNHFDGPRGSLRTSTINDIVAKLFVTTVPAGTKVFRIRLNLSAEQKFLADQFDSPPIERARGFSRFDSKREPILYTSPSLLVCIHECRVTLADDIYAATLRTTRDLRMADLSENYYQPEDVNPFDDLRYFFGGLMLSSRTYNNCRRIARAIRADPTIDGIMYSSFFTNVIDAPAVNYGFFGYPVANGALEVSSINTIRIDKIDYEFALGPVFE